MTQSEQELKLALIKSIQKWADNQSTTENWPDIWWHDTQTEDMADAAFTVFLGSLKAQKYALDNQ